MNFSLVKSFLPHMTKEDMRVIQVTNWYLSYYRRFPEKLENWTMNDIVSMALLNSRLNRRVKEI